MQVEGATMVCLVSGISHPSIPSLIIFTIPASQKFGVSNLRLFLDIFGVLRGDHYEAQTRLARHCDLLGAVSCGKDVRVDQMIHIQKV
jgi:hypothetical protein